jgi:hypothetical protein
VEVDFSAVTLLDGQTYTILLSNDTARWGRVVVGNQYAGGVALYGGTKSPAADALFRVQWQADSRETPAPDFGDAPDDRQLQGYPTFLIHDGARHEIGGPWLGAESDFPDSENDGQPNSFALGDDWGGRDDENGVSIPMLTRGVQSDITVEVSGGGGVLDAWIDWDGDKAWERSERIYGGFLGDGVHLICVTPPLDSAAGGTYARFRISSKGGLMPVGPAGDGEVEDYLVTIQPGETDYFPNAMADVGIMWPMGPVERVSLAGSSAWEVFVPPSGQAADTDADGLDQVQARMMQMNLAGASSMGLVTVRLVPGAPSAGQIEEQANSTPGILDVPPFTPVGLADSFFDVFLEVTIGGEVLHTASPVPLRGVISHKPPAPGETYFGAQGPVELLNDDGNPTGIFLFSPSYTPNAALDFGDAPDQPYPTLLVNDGARHLFVAGCHLGSLVDVEPDGQPDPQAAGDDLSGVDDEDGVVFTSPLVPGLSATVAVWASMPGYLSAWIDFNGLGSWDDPGDRIFDSVALDAGINHLWFSVPVTAGQGIETFARFRFSTRPVLSYAGPAADGEVEDYMVMLQPPEVDLFVDSLAAVVLDIPGLGADAGMMTGLLRWEVTVGAQGQASDTDGDGRDQVPARMWWEMAWTSPLFGAVVVHAGAPHLPSPPWNPPRPELGQIEELVNNTPGILDVPPFTATGQADSFFDVFFEVELPALGLSFLSVDPKRLAAILTHKPAACGETYADDGIPLPLYKWGGTTPVAFLRIPLYVPDPGLEIDQFANSLASVTLDIPGMGSDTVRLSGPSAMHVLVGERGQARDYDEDGRDQAWAELVQLELKGTSPIFGPILVRLRGAAEAPGMGRSLGQMEELVNNTPGILDVPPFTPAGMVDSFFDVFFEIELPALGIVVYNDVPKFVQTVLTHKPAARGETYVSGFSQYTPLLDAWGNLVGFLGATSYTPNPLLESIWLGRFNDHWEMPVNWSAGTPGPETVAVFETAAPNQPVLYGDQSVGGIEFRSAGWKIGGSGFALTVGRVGVDSAGAGFNSIGPSAVLAADSTWTIGADNTLNLAAPLSGGDRRLNKDGPGTFLLRRGQDRTTGLALNIDVGTVMMGDGYGPLVLSGLAIGPRRAVLDLVDSSLIVHYADGVPGEYSPALLDVRQWIISAYAGGTWAGPGITSAFVATYPQSLGLGYAQNDLLDSPYSEFAGERVDGNTVLVKPTYLGDVALNGDVDLDDLILLAAYWDPGHEYEHMWWQGDMNYDGWCDLDDLILLAGNWQLGVGSPLSDASGIPPEAAELVGSAATGNQGSALSAAAVVALTAYALTPAPLVAEDDLGGGAGPIADGERSPLLLSSVILAAAPAIAGPTAVTSAADGFGPMLTVDSERPGAALAFSAANEAAPAGTEPVPASDSEAVDLLALPSLALSLGA